MKEALQDLFDSIIKDADEDEIFGEIDDLKSDYLDEGWEDSFDSRDEAYAETGRGAAESDVLNDLITNNGGEDLSTDDHCELFDKLAEHYSLTTN